MASLLIEGAQPAPRRKPRRVAASPTRAKGKPRFKVSGQPDEAFREWIRGFACLLNGRDPYYACPLGVLGSECAHVRARGAGGMDRANCVPLCHHHHGEQHTLGIRSFEKRYGLDLKVIAANLWARYQPRRAGVPPEGSP